MIKSPQSNNSAKRSSRLGYINGKAGEVFSSEGPAKGGGGGRARSAVSKCRYKKRRTHASGPSPTEPYHRKATPSPQTEKTKKTSLLSSLSNSKKNKCHPGCKRSARHYGVKKSHGIQGSFTGPPKGRGEGPLPPISAFSVLLASQDKG